MRTVVFVLISQFVIALSSLAGPPPPRIVGPSPTIPPQSGSFGAVDLGFTETGLNSIRYGKDEFLSDGDFQMLWAGFTDAKGNTTGGDMSHTTSINVNAHTVTKSYSWGKVSAEYFSDANHVNIGVTITNDTSSTLDSLTFNLATLKFPKTPKQYDGNTILGGQNVGSPTAAAFSYGSGVMVLANDDVKSPLGVNLPWPLDGPNKTVFPLRIVTGRDGMYPTSYPVINRPIAAGASLSFNISLRFGPAGSTVTDLSGDIFEKFRATFPYKLHWDDRRPIAALHLENSGQSYPKNPRGWFNDANLDITTPQGVAAFHAKMLRYADESIAIIKDMNSQGMIVWDIEGGQYPQGVTYIGDPRMIPALAPEMAGVVDEFFKKFRDAGIPVGMTLRPCDLVVYNNGQDAYMVDAEDPVKNLTDKITYAKNRWGATLFYVDSNGDINLPIDAKLFQKVADAFPDVLLIPECSNPRYYSFSAPYCQMRPGYVATRPEIRNSYPQAVNVIRAEESLLDSNYDEVVAGVRGGDILMFRGWFNDTQNAKVKKIYEEAAKP